MQRIDMTKCYDPSASRAGKLGKPAPVRRDMRACVLRACALQAGLLAGVAVLLGAQKPETPSSSSFQKEHMNEIQEDIQTIVGGHFTPDALSPEVYDAVAARAKAQANQYLEVFESMYLSDDFDAIAQSRLYLPSFLELVRASAPARTRKDAGRLLKLYTAVLIIFDNALSKDALFALLPEETVRTVKRLDIRRNELREVISPVR
jgi:hypothetical protein